MNPTASKPKRTLSVVIPARNAERTLAFLLDDVLALKMPNAWQKEIVVAYAKSPDNTRAIIESRDVKLARCKVIGPSAARNVAVKESTGCYLYFIDADARPHGKDFFLKLIDTIERLETSGNFGGFGGPIMLEASQRWNPIAQADHFVCWYNWLYWRASGETRLFQPTASCVFSRSVFDKLGGFDEKLRVLEDYDLHKRALEAGYRFHFTQNIPVTHHARASLLESWQHSWHWGAPYRSAYLEKSGQQSLPFGTDSIWFSLNLPIIFAHRLRQVFRAARRTSVSATIVSFPFIVATLLSWAIAAAFGREQATANRTHAK